ncbi:tRNA (N(6)-L-threonylcarbamoyladenosine(37)-C(2))-methylthiotransferase MtaB, partial [Alphaproteobacteria bacterium]|nr:tRNA (N(6)-L-threonylcarbamoyladenosine(37)-C(2))-methylthiotransferase MtaB [Alphaproteobacteria bacterium]
NFGCRLNNFEGKKIEELLPKQQNESSVIVINSCAVTNETERQVRQTIRKVKKTNPNSKLILTGCAAQISPSTYSQMEEVDLLVDNISKLKPETWINLFDENHEGQFINDIFEKYDDADPVLNSESLGPRESLVIQQGCNHRCTFCIIPFGRGNNRSFDPAFLIKEVQRHVSQGVKEIVLTGVDISDYGSDFNKHYCMSNLILDILNKTDLERLRLSSIDCAEIDDHFDEVLINPRVMPHLHLSLQSGDNMILKRMKRRHNTEDIKKFVSHCRNLRNEITFGADIIAGFPTETDDMFRNTYELLKNCNISHLHIFPFSPKKNTPAARMPQVEKSIIKKRALELRVLGDELVSKIKKNLISPRKILIEEINNGEVVGYDQNYMKHHIPMIGLPIGEIVTQ